MTPQTPNARILVVDDEPSIRSFLVRVLAREGYQVESAQNGQEALHILHSHPVDLLLSDIRMDQLDGVGLLQQARQRFPDLVVILLTGHATVESAVTALNEGAYQYLLKPAKNADILAAVTGGLARRREQSRLNRLEQVAEQISALTRGESTPVPTAEAEALVPGADRLQVGRLTLDTAAYQVHLDGHMVALTLTEFRLLHALVEDPGRAYDYVHLVQTACGYESSRAEAREIIGTHVRNLRKKMGVAVGAPLYVESVRGIGYRIIPDPTV